MINIATTHASDAPRGTSLAPGFYNALIIAAKDDYDEKNRKQYIYLELQVDDGSGSFPVLKDWIYVTDRTVWKVEQLLAACGWEFGAGAQIQVEGSSLKGRRILIATCKRRSTQGGIFAAVLSYMRAQDVPHMGAMTQEDMATFKLTPSGEREDEQPTAQNSRRTASYQQGQQQYQQPQQGYRAPASQQYQQNQYQQPQQGYQQQGSGYAATHNGQQDLADDDLPF